MYTYVYVYNYIYIYICFNIHSTSGCLEVPVHERQPARVRDSRDVPIPGRGDHIEPYYLYHQVFHIAQHCYHDEFTHKMHNLHGKRRLVSCMRCSWETSLLLCCIAILLEITWPTSEYVTFFELCERCRCTCYQTCDQSTVITLNNNG